MRRLLAGRRWLVIAAVILLLALGVGAWLGEQALGHNASDPVVLRDFHADQAALAQALAQGDAAPLAGDWTGNALQTAEQEVGRGAATRTLQEQSVEVLQAADPNDPSVTTEVHQVAAVTTSTTSAQGSQETRGPDQVEGRYWLRKVDGRWAITDLT